MAIRSLTFDDVYVPQKHAIFYKGLDGTPEEDGVGTMLSNLAEYTAVPIKDLPVSLANEHKTLSRMVGFLNDDGFASFHNLIKEKFEGLDTTIPGTVGAYYGGCLSTNSTLPEFIGKECAVTCAGGVGLPGKWKGCSNRVYWIDKDGMTVTNDIESSSAIVFYDVTVPVKTRDRYVNQALKDSQKHGVEMYAKVGRDQATDNYTDPSEFIHLPRREKEHHPSPEHNKLWLIVIIVLLIIALVYFVRKKY